MEHVATGNADVAINALSRGFDQIGASKQSICVLSNVQAAFC
jgi:hypothetical protein